MTALPRTPSFRLDGRRALVTGGSRGIGLGAAMALAEAGAAVTLVARSGAGLDAVCGAMVEQGLDAASAVLDVTDVDAVRGFVDASAAFDILVNSAGGSRHAHFLDVTEPDYQAIIDLNLKSTLFVGQAVAARLVAEGRGGSIVNVSSQMGLVGGPKRAVYSASKFAVEGLTRAMAIELGPHAIRVNTICPTFIETEMTSAALNDADFRTYVLGKIKLGRLARVEDLMGAFVFLASDASAMVTGSSLVVDGGWTAE